MGEATRIPRAIPAHAGMRLTRLRRLAWVLDRSVSLGGNRRFGLDPVIGLIPVVGDWLGAVISLYVVYEGLRLGLPWPVLWRMLGNIAVEAGVGIVPIVGDVFDFIWQASTRNLRLVERYYHPRLEPRSGAALFAFLGGVILFLVLTAVAALSVGIWMLKQIVALF